MKINIRTVLPIILCLMGITSTMLQAQTWERPFTANSIWNTRIGDGAAYVPANLGQLGLVANDRTFLFETNSWDPSRMVYQPPEYGSYPTRAIHIPDWLTVPDEKNGCVTFLQPDGRTLREYNEFRRPWPGSDPIGFFYFDVDLYGDGIRGGHGGAGLSNIGPAIRVGQLESDDPIGHALGIELDWAVLYRNYGSPYNQEETFRWPADRSDGNGPGFGGVPGYGGSNPALRMGSLCAIPQSVDINSLGLTPYGRKIAQAMQDYGAYVVDSTGIYWWVNGGYTMSLCTEAGATTEYFPQDNHYRSGIDFYEDMKRIYAVLAVVDDNRPDNIGGGSGPNLLANPGFEANGGSTQTPAGWSEWSDTGSNDASFTEANGGGVGGGAGDGIYNASHWKESNYRVYTYQNLTGLANGTYTLKARMRRSGGQIAAHMEAKNFGSNGNVSHSAPVGSAWQEVSPLSVQVSNGQCTIGFWSQGYAYQWMQFDAVSFTKD